MSIDANITDAALLQLIGERLARLRLAKNLTQQQLAEQAGLSLRTVQRLELGETATQLSGFIRVCRVLGIVAGLDALLPAQTASPMEQLAQLAQLKRAGHTRKRASSRKPARQPAAGEPQKKWTWGETP
jgi:transcriptional regulator with XRE-family HTH domain